MRPTLLALLGLFFAAIASAQNVGVGFTNPQARLHVYGAMAEKLRLENPTALAVDVNNELYFKSGSWFTGAIKSIGTGSSTARLGFFGFAQGTPATLREYLTIADNGLVGISNTAPDNAGLVVDKKVGATNAVFGSNSTGVALESGWPGIGLNSYYGVTRKAIAAGFSGLVGQNPNNGDIFIQSTAATLAADADVPLNLRLLINKDGNVGLQGNNNPQSPLSFANTLGEKINFYEVNATANYGIGVQGAQLQVYTGGAGDAISFGYGSSAAFTERVRMQNAYTIINNGRLQFKGSYGGNAHGIDFTNNAGTTSRGFMGMLDDNTMGFFGYGGGGWGLLWDVNDYSLRIGTAQKAAGYTLNIGGKAIAEEVRVQLRASWPDYVFKNGYELMPLAQLETFIKANNRLPNIPKADVLEKEGTDLGEMQRKMMEKIEELTLHLIQQQKEIEALKTALKAKTVRR